MTLIEELRALRDLPEGLVAMVECLTTGDKMPAVVVVPHWLLEWKEAHELYRRLKQAEDKKPNDLEQACLASLMELAASQGHPIPTEDQ